MTYREQLLAAIRGEPPTAGLPWAPRMDLWSLALTARGTLPRGFEGLDKVGIAKLLDVACHCTGGDGATAAAPGDDALCALGIGNHPDAPYRVVLRDLPITIDADATSQSVSIRTPAGDVTTRLTWDDRMLRAGISLRWVEKYAVETIADIEAVASVFDHLEVIPAPEQYDRFRNRVGEQGLAVAAGPPGASPMHLVLHELMNMEQFFYLYIDEPAALAHLVERIEPYFEAVLSALVACSAEMVLWGGNYDEHLTPPPFFGRELKPWLRRAAAQLGQADKYFMTHTDGENRGLFSAYKGCGIDVAESVCPAPMTACTLAELRSGFGSATTIWGGIPSVALLPASMDDRSFDEFLDHTFAELGSGRRLILGVSDMVPPDADMKRLEVIGQRAADFRC